MDILKELRQIGISAEMGYKTSDIVTAISQCKGSTAKAAMLLWSKKPNKVEQAPAQDPDAWLQSLGKPKALAANPVAQSKWVNNSKSDKSDTDKSEGTFGRTGSDEDGTRRRKSWLGRRSKSRDRLEDDEGDSNSRKKDKTKRRAGSCDAAPGQSTFTTGVGLHTREEGSGMNDLSVASEDKMPAGRRPWSKARGFFRRSRKSDDSDGDEH
jgi:hypothetical protein